ncbi:hypothetical protein A2947_03230 [Candidatus Peribacteria bacterium RIFCSPLOWO2_01_FULL_54_110]|nr:MAG: hypothetical protein A2947_03230 [Candidatus Peribacteria bacterium RIFCSPLOWO2_01_FULL_54_110]
MKRKGILSENCPCGSGKKLMDCHGSKYKSKTGPQITYKFADEGSADPFIARMMIQIHEIAATAFSDPKERGEFERLYEPVLQNFREARYAAENFVQMVNDYEEKINNGEWVFKDDEGNFEITETIRVEANLLFKDFFIRARMAMDNILKVAIFLKRDIGFAYDSDKKFEEGVAKIAVIGGNVEYHRMWCQMIREARGTWLTNLIKTRVEIEHDGFTLPHLRCELSSGKPRLIPWKMADGQDVRETIQNYWKHVFHYNELLMIFLLSTHLPSGMGIMSIPPRNRDPHCPVAFFVRPEPSGNFEIPDTWEEVVQKAEESNKAYKPPKCSLRITDASGKQFMLLDYFPDDKGGATLQAVNGTLPLEMFLIPFSVQAAKNVRGRHGIVQNAHVDNFTEEEFKSWETKIPENSNGTILAKLEHAVSAPESNAV